MRKPTSPIEKKIQELEAKRRERTARKRMGSTRLVSAPAKVGRPKKRRKEPVSTTIPPTLRKVPRDYAEAKALYGTAWYNEWRERIFARDKFTCQMCGQRANNLEAHHIRPKYLYPELTLDENNGITLCKICHQDRVTKHEHRFVFIFDRIVKLNR